MFYFSVLIKGIDTRSLKKSGLLRFLVNAARVRFTDRPARTRQPSRSSLAGADWQFIRPVRRFVDSRIHFELCLIGPGWLNSPPTSGSPRGKFACPSACRPPRRLARVEVLTTNCNTSQIKVNGGSCWSCTMLTTRSQSWEDFCCKVGE